MLSDKSALLNQEPGQRQIADWIKEDRPDIIKTLENNQETGKTGFKDIYGIEICFGDLVGHPDCDLGIWEQIVVSENGVPMGYGDIALKDFPAEEIAIFDPYYNEEE